MEISSAIQPNTAAATNAAARSVLSSDFETFLRMLTAQARFQDPLEPINSSEYAAQLALFSMVEQQVLSNDLLRTLGTQLSGGSLAGIAGWIGMEARSTAPRLFDGAPVEVFPRPDAGADSAALIVRDAAGQEVQRLIIPARSEPMLWAGVTDDGAAFPSALYSFEVESRQGGEVIATAPAETYARITEAQMVDGVPKLILAGGAELATDAVTALREGL